MASRVAAMLLKRQTPFSSDPDDLDDGDYDYDGDDWWWSPTGMAVRYTVVLLLFAGILIFFVGGYLHARRRIRKGLAPLPYHRWMVRRYTRQPQNNTYAGAHSGPTPESYDMHSFPAPPPAYNHNEAPPPVYQPPEGASKAMADQNFHASQTHRAGEQSSAGQSSAFPAAATRQ